MLSACDRRLFNLMPIEDKLRIKYIIKTALDVLAHSILKNDRDPTDLTLHDPNTCWMICVLEIMIEERRIRFISHDGNSILNNCQRSQLQSY